MSLEEVEEEHRITVVVRMDDSEPDVGVHALDLGDSVEGQVLAQDVSFDFVDGERFFRSLLNFTTADFQREISAIAFTAFELGRQYEKEKKNSE